MTQINITRLLLLFAVIATPFRAAEPLKLENLSVRLYLSSRAAHVGFFVSNSSGGADSPAPIKVLVRAAGPSLNAFVGSGAANGVEMVQGLGGVKGKVLATWKDARSQIIAAAASVGAFPYGMGSGDDAMILEVPAGSFTVIVSAKEAGESIVEAYRLP